MRKTKSSSKSKLRRRNENRVKKARITADFIKNIPEGVTYSPGTGPLIQKPTAKNAGDDIVKVGDFVFDVEKVSKTTLISMRKFLPSEEYRLLKNRKSARLCRRKRKEERNKTQKTLQEVVDELSQVHKKLAEVEKRLKESEKEKEDLQKRL